MKVDNFIKTCFPEDNKFVVPEINEIDKLTTTWTKLIKNFKKDFGPKTKSAKIKIQDVIDYEQKLANELINNKRRKIEAESNLQKALKEDEVQLKKILGKYEGEKLFQEISRLKTLQVESLVLLPQSNPKKTREGLQRDPLSDSSIKNLEKKLPFIVIITKPLKTEIPADEELAKFSLLKRRQVKSWGGKDIGRFIIIIDLNKEGRSGLTIYNLDYIVDGAYDHACINDGHVCFGNISETYDNLEKKYYIFDMVDLIFDHLTSVTTARPVSNPYIEWDAWFTRVKPREIKKLKLKIENTLSKSGDLLFTTSGIGSYGLTVTPNEIWSMSDGQATQTYTTATTQTLNNQHLPQQMENHLQRLERELREQQRAGIATYNNYRGPFDEVAQAPMEQDYPAIHVGYDVPASGEAAENERRINEATERVLRENSRNIRATDTLDRPTFDRVAEELGRNASERLDRAVENLRTEENDV